MALTFITLCRIAGIPARWESGFAVAPGDAGCHDWARFYVAPKGWMYADCSYGASMARRGDECSAATISAVWIRAHGDKQRL